MKKNITTPLILLFAAVFAITPFAIDSYLPAIPVIAEDLNTQTSLVAITVSIYILGLAIGQLIGGPLSDRFGRMPIIVVGLLIFALGSLLLANAQSLAMLWIWRVLQSLGGGIAVVGIPAIIRDNTVGKESARLFSLIMLITMLAPSIAPTVGTVILKTLNWHWIFITLCLFAVIIALSAVFVMPKTMQAKKSNTSAGYLSIFKERRALGYLLAQGFAYAVLMTFLTNAPFAYLEHFQVTAELFSGLLIINIVGVVIVNRTNSLLLRRYEPANLIKVFLAMQLIGGMVLVSSILITPDNLWFAVAGFVLSTAANAGILPNSSTCFMHYFEKNAGVASALLGTVQFAIAAAVSALAAMLSHDSLWPMILTMLAANLLALAGVFAASRTQYDNETEEVLITPEAELLAD